MPQAFLRVAADRRALRRGGFARLAGTARGFDLAAADLRRWLLVTDHEPDVDRWAAGAAESAVLILEPLASRGSWGGWSPAASGRRWDGPVVSLTHARLRPLRERRFRRAVPPVADQVLGAGARWWTAFGETPVGVQGTVSVWPSAAAVEAFARTGAHRAVVERTPRERWYAEELFTRCALLDATGTLDGAPAADLLLP